MNGTYYINWIKSPAPVWHDWSCWWGDKKVTVARYSVINIDVKYASYDDGSAHQEAQNLDTDCGFDLKGAERSVRSFGSKFKVPKFIRDRLLHCLEDGHGEAVARVNCDRLNKVLAEKRKTVLDDVASFLDGISAMFQTMDQDELEDMSYGNWTWNRLEDMCGWHLFNDARDCGIFPERYVADKMVAMARKEVRRRKKEKTWKK